MDPNQPNQDDNHTGDGRQAIFSSPTTEPAPAPQPAETVAPVQPAEPIAAPTEPAPTVGATPAAKPVIDPSMPEPASDPTPVAAPTTNPEPVATPGIIASTPTIATPAETGDIMLSPDGPRQHNKRPFIIAAIILVVVLVIVGVVLAATGGLFGKRYSAEEVKEKWLSYTTILEKGPAEAEYNLGSWWIEYAGNFSYLDEEQTTYIKQLETSYSDFTTAIKASPVKLEGDAKEALDTNTVLFNAATQFLRANVLAKSAYATYDSDGYDAAIVKIDAEYPDASANDLVKQLFASTRTYLKAALDIYKAEQENQCIDKETNPSTTCIETLSNNIAQADQLENDFEEASSEMYVAYSNLIVGLKSCIDVLNEVLL